jgi:hypothetical protein
MEIPAGVPFDRDLRARRADSFSFHCYRLILEEVSQQKIPINDAPRSCERIIENSFSINALSLSLSL